MSPVPVRRQPITLLPDSTRVLLRSFILSGPEATRAIIGRALDLTETQVLEELEAIHQAFDPRHLDLEARLLECYLKVEAWVPPQPPLSSARKRLIGAQFAGEYGLESAALFNPSLVAHPDQEGVAAGALRIIMSLRATGEGHISSIEFRAGLLSAQGELTLEPISRFVSRPEILANPTYRKLSFVRKLEQLGCDSDGLAAVMAPLGEHFTRTQLAASVAQRRQEPQPANGGFARTLAGLQWLTDCNYELQFPASLALSERVLFPVSAIERNGIEDARFVRFLEDDGSARYYATYTAYDGREILPQLIETHDFLHFRILTLNGDAIQNKGMALFPRRINGQYAMLSRQDDQNILIMFSSDPHFWNAPEILVRPEQVWESVKIGNCGSPLETEAGWLVLTHGVGPLRRYCIGAVLLDLQDPRVVIGRLREPLLCAEGSEREGYVPNVVYSCGALLHGPELILPYAMSDRASTVASIALEGILQAMQPVPKPATQSGE